MFLLKKSLNLRLVSMVLMKRQQTIKQYFTYYPFGNNGCDWKLLVPSFLAQVFLHGFCIAHCNCYPWNDIFYVCKISEWKGSKF